MAATATQLGGFARPFGTGELYAINADGGQQIVLAGGNRNRVGRNTENGGFFVLDILYYNRVPGNRSILAYASGGGKPGAYRINVYTGKHHRVATSPLANGGMLADNKGRVRLAWGTNAKTGKPELAYRPAGSMDWKDETSLLNKKAAASLATGSPITFSSDNKAVYLTSWTDNAAETLGLYRYDFDTGKKILLYANPVVDVGGEFPDYNPWIYSFDGK